jgi:peptidyl-prolyl cis-trans isomerase A (cyclophilin A)
MIRLLCSALLAAALAAQTPPPKQPGSPKKAAPTAPSKLMNPAALNEKAPEDYRARFVTSRGEFVIAVHRSWAPLAADRFYNLVKNGFYDGCVFFRVLPGFVVQWGLHPNPAVQARWEKARLKDEPRKQRNRLGYVAFAATGETDSRSTQVFINLKDSPDLDAQGFAPFGDVVQGIGVTAILNSRHGQKPDQQRILKQGNAYLKATFPDLDYIKSAVIE